jgi:acetyl-CoA acetyltransferase
MYQYGTSPAQLAEIAVAARRWGHMNPKAWVRDALIVEDVLSSRMMCDPLHKLDCCLITDGGGVVVSRDERGTRWAGLTAGWRS